MAYHIPQEFIMPNNFSILWNTYLSQADKQIINAVYPYTIKENKFSKDDKRAIMESDNPLQILKLRFAKGEISKDEFLEMRRILES
jgi:uncharacterized membrane protein